MNRITGVATKFNYQGKLEIRIDKASYDQLYEQFRFYLCKTFNRCPPCLFRTENRTRQYYICFTLNKLDRKEDYCLLGQSVTIRYKLRAHKIKGASGLVAQLMDVVQND